MLLFDIIRFSFLRFFAYPFEILAEVVRTCIEVFFLILFWTVIVKNSSIPLSLPAIISYFLIVTGIKEVVMAQFGDFGGHIGKMARTGEISNVLMKPFNPIGFLYATSLGREGLHIFISFCMILVGIAINPPSSILGVLLFLIFLVIAWSVCFSYNLFEGSIFFYIPDAQGIRGSMGHIIGIFSGMLIPLYLLPDWLYGIVRFTPFPSMVYGPVFGLQSSVISAEVLLNLGVGIFWSIALFCLSYLFWRRATKNYEATGI